MDYWLAPTLVTLRDEINEACPKRDKSSDGWIGDKAHASRDSDHNPSRWPISWSGVVRAYDFDEDLRKAGWTMQRVVNKMVTLFGKHPGLLSGSYIIYEGRIISYDRLAEGWRPYSGSNPHDKHAHISTSTEARYYNSTEPWNIFEEENDMTPEQAATLDRAARDAARAVARGQVNTRLMLRIADQLGVKIDDLKALIEDDA